MAERNVARGPTIGTADATSGRSQTAGRAGAAPAVHTRHTCRSRVVRVTSTNSFPAAMTRSRLRRAGPLLALALVPLTALAVVAAPAAAQTSAAQTAAAAQPFAVEYSYTIKWGFVEEWMDLYKRNHYPVLLRQQEMGRIVRMSAVTPVHHAGEADRWDLRFTIVWKDAATAHDGFDSAAIARSLYPDQATFKREEQRRFELLLEHTDVPVKVDDLRGWKR